MTFIVYSSKDLTAQKAEKKFTIEFAETETSESKALKLLHQLEIRKTLVCGTDVT